MTSSLGFLTDLALRAAEGSAIERSAGAIVVRTPRNPGFRWGNFLLATSVDEGPAFWADAHAAAFPDADFVTVGIDDAQAAFDETAWRAAGFEVERLIVLTASAAPPPVDGVEIVPLETDAEWRAVLTIEHDEGAEPPDAGYETARLAQRRLSVDTGRAVWLGVRVGGEIVATTGIADAGDGIARFQDVQTLTTHRRRGYAGALVAACARVAVERFGARRLVLLAVPDGPSIGLYRRLGFLDTETQVQLSRVGGTAT